MTDGRCTLCGETYTKRGMTRHLRSCLGDVPESSDASAFHLRIGGAHRTDYWLHLAVDRDTTLATLDAFLREIWLECCGHMSSFTIDGTEYVRPYADEDVLIGHDRRPMDVSIGDVLDGDTDRDFTHEYDFGTTTELAIRVVDLGHWNLETPEVAGGGTEGVDEDGIHLLARNEPPEIECGECGDPATVVCQGCLYERGPDAWLCDDCADDHDADCDRPAFLPRVNSPRTGVCGYTGEHPGIPGRTGS